MTPTPEQEAILEAERHSASSLFIRSYAGVGKTTTLELLAKQIRGPALALAFNVKIKEELRRRLPVNIEVKSFNGLGHSAWTKAIGRRPEVDPQKLGKVCTAVLPRRCPEGWWEATRRAVTLAMQRGLVPTGERGRGLIEDSPEAWSDLLDEADAFDLPAELPREALRQSIAQGFRGVISYDDQIYLSALFGGVFAKYPLVLVDEAQDLSELNCAQVQRSASSRLIVAGDQLQAVYAFRGASYTSMEQLRKLRSDWIDLPLATTFRCPKAIVARQQQHAPEFRAASEAPEGFIEWLPRKNEQQDECTWSWADVEDCAEHSIAILCRNNAPLLSLAFRLLRAGVPVHMLGRDIGKGLAALLTKLSTSDDSSQVLLGRVREWAEREATGATPRKKESLQDRAECIAAVVNARPDLRTVGELKDHLTKLFGRTSAKVTLSTIHRAKGLEWDTVLHLDPWRIPSCWAASPAELQQESNLRYVAETRTKSTLVLANLEDFR